MLFENSKPIFIPETLLKMCLSAFNQIPNKKLRSGTTTYDLASQIEDLLTLQEKDSNYLVLIEALQKLFQIDGSPCVSIFWSIDHIQSMRPYLTRDQALQVLSMVRDKYDSSIGITWEVLGLIADQIKRSPADPSELSDLN